MQIDYCLILAAGFGTRMGQIGQKVPKVLWPVFEKSLLELQVAYARSLGITKIYINLHYMGEEIETYCKGKVAFEGVTFLWEKPEILDIGGAVHNLARQEEVNYSGKLLVLNADQFFYLKKEELFKILSPYEKFSGVLLTYWVNSSLGYNALEIDSDRLVKGIIKNKELGANQKIETYTGISYVDLSQLEKTSGVSKFFDSVCPFTKKKIPALLLDDVDYWDFGTVKRYWETCFSILETYRTKSTHPFLRFLIQERAIKSWKINLKELSYHATGSKIINLNADEITTLTSPTIVLFGYGAKNSTVPCVWWNEIKDEVK
jgi:NDP-sugar pyrophosphorylase family protein